MKILVTGISGRIGANLARSLVETGHQVRGLVWEQDSRQSKLSRLDVELVTGSLTSSADVERAVEGVDAVYHLGAAFQGGGPFSNDQYFEINVRGTFNMLEAARLRVPNLQHFFFAGTDALYNKYIPGGVSDPIQEDTMPIEPGGMYALTKALGEELCRGYARNYGLPVAVFRFAMALAADEVLAFPQFRLGHWRRVYADAQTEAARGTSQQLQALDLDDDALLIVRDAGGRSYKKHIVDVRDLVDGMLCGIGNQRIGGEAIQLAAPAAYTWEETIPYLADKLALAYADVQLHGRNPTNYEFDLSKCRNLLGFTPQYDIYRMIDSALAFRAGNDSSVIPT